MLDNSYLILCSTGFDSSPITDFYRVKASTHSPTLVSGGNLATCFALSYSLVAGMEVTYRGSALEV